MAERETIKVNTFVYVVLGLLMLIPAKVIDKTKSDFWIDILFVVVTYFLGTYAVILGKSKTKVLKVGFFLIGILITLCSLFILKVENIVGLIGIYIGTYWVSHKLIID